MDNLLILTKHKHDEKENDYYAMAWRHSGGSYAHIRNWPFSFCAKQSQESPADPATFEKIPANRLNAGTFTVNRATGEAVDISVTVDFFLW